MNCPKCGSTIISNGVGVYHLYWRCIYCDYETSTLKQQPKAKTKPEVKEMLEQLKLDAEVAYLKFLGIINEAIDYVESSTDLRAEMDEQIEEHDKTESEAKE